MKCQGLLCTDEATHAFIYGCIEGHIKERLLCETHLKVYPSAVTAAKCWCKERYEEAVIGILPKMPEPSNTRDSLRMPGRTP